MQSAGTFGRIVMLASLGIVGLGACGRSAIPNFEVESRNDEVFDPVVDGCNKVDYLFIVDNSASMGDNQHKLARSALDFVDGIATVLDVVDSVHIGVLTTDAYVGNELGCRHLGALVDRTSGQNSSNRECGPFEDGHRYMTEEDDLESAIDCTVRVGTQGSTAELPLAALREALDPGSEDVVACNEGFLRPDALLVVIIVTDEDAQSGGVHEAVVNAKGGNAEAVVVLTIAHTAEDTCGRTAHAEQADVLAAFTRRFEHGTVESICGTSFEDAFRSATETVVDACGG